MKCSECGADLTGADKFCSNCGAAVPSSIAVPSGDAAPSDDAALAASEASESSQPGPEPILDDDSQLEEIEPIEQDAEPDLEPLLPFEQAPPDVEPEATAPPPVVKATGKRNTGLIIAIVVLVILLLCCCCAIGVIAANFEEISLILEEILEATY